ncbi:hypothetical protein [Nocardiopsis lambiniae]|uniref:Uncharacterized protein n=1 Tax=Nocardiopsis lambiniae TaxID=3075539 RepID=A0ABU2MGW0_9ACTN|nr:hypothetical protein [Nocardiopsis sp. DSM 44743]MDT0331949.1 hypothetical protein [Nocardiopsis sp. DSM 44743]
MVDEFRDAFQRLIDASVAADPREFPSAVNRVLALASRIPVSERELALEALAPLLTGDHAAPGITADLCVVAGALVEMGTDPGPSGPEVLRRLRAIGRGAIVFARAWQRTGGGHPPDPDSVTADDEARVAGALGADAPGATMCWWTVARHGLAAKTMLSRSGVRSHVRRDPTLHAELVAVTNQLGDHLPDLHQVRALLRMAEAGSALILDRRSGRAFRVLFDGIGDNFQLHTLLADALVGASGRGLDGDPPDPRWVRAFRDGEPDPAARTVRGWWNLVAHDGTWVWNEGVPAEIPTLRGEHIVVLDEQPYPRSWNARRRHPQVRGWLEVEEELTEEEADLWWKRVAPAEPAIPDPTDDATPIPEPILAGDDQGAERIRGFLPPEPDPVRAAEPPPQAPPAPTPMVGEPAPRPEPSRPEPRRTGEPSSGGTGLPPLPPGVSNSSAWGPTWR